MKNFLIKAFIGIVTLCAMPSMAKAECSSDALRESPSCEVMVPTDDIPDMRVTVNSTTRSDGTTIILVRTTIVLNGRIVSDNMELIIVK